TEQQALLGELRGHGSPVWQVSWAHPKYGSILASVGYDRQIIIWREKITGGYHQHQQSAVWEQLYCDKSHTASVNSCAFAPWEYGLVLAAGSSDGSISVLTHEQVSTWSRKVIPQAHLGGVLAVSWSPATTPSTLASGPAVQQQPSSDEQVGPRRIVSGGNDNQVRIWRMDESTGEWSMETELPSGKHTDVVRDVAWRPNAGIPTQHIASCSEDGSVVIWQCDMEGQAWKVAQEFHMKAAAYRLSWSITGTVLAVALADNTVELIKENVDGQFVHLNAVDEQGVPADADSASHNGMMNAAYGSDSNGAQDPHNVAAAILGSAILNHPEHYSSSGIAAGGSGLAGAASAALLRPLGDPGGSGHGRESPDEESVVLLYRKSNFITLPRDSSPYTMAKRAENARDYRRALYWHTQCIQRGIRAVSAIMDVAGLFNKFSKKEEALSFMAQYKHLVPKDRYQGFRRLYERVEYDLNRPAQVAPRMLKVTVVPSSGMVDGGMELGEPPQWHSASTIASVGRLEEGPLNVKLLDRLFPNPEKIEFLALCEADPDTGSQVAYVQFESQSSARKAIITEKVLCNIVVAWAEKGASMLPPPDEDIIATHLAADSERCITSPFDSSLVIYTVPLGWEPEIVLSAEPEMDLRFATSVKGDTPSRTATTPVGEKGIVRTGEVMERLQGMPRRLSADVSSTSPARSFQGGNEWALQFTQKMIVANRMLEELSPAHSESEMIILAEAYESAGRFDAAFRIYAHTAMLHSALPGEQLRRSYEVVDCVIRCAVIAAIWGGSFDTGCRILDCVVSANPSLEFLAKAAANLASLMGNTEKALS
ncbi:GTPase-activating protein S13, partial [Perkinsus olseni]